MPSHLTRQVFRRILANEPIIHRGCLRRQAYSSIAGSRRQQSAFESRNGLGGRHGGFPVIRRYQQRRTLFGLGLFRSKPPRDARDANYEPGIEKMMEYAKMKRMKARLPPVEDVADAFKDYFEAKDVTLKGSMQDTHAELVLASLNYVLQAQQGRATNILLDSKVLALAMMHARREPPQPTAIHMRLVRKLYEQLSTSETPDKFANTGFTGYIEALCWSGRATSARDILLRREAAGPSSAELREASQIEEQSPASKNLIIVSWNRVLQGFCREDDEAGLLQTLEMMDSRGHIRGMRTINTMLEFYLRRDDSQQIARWWAALRPMVCQPIGVASPEGYNEALSLVSKLLKWCLANEELQLGHEVVRDVMKSNPVKSIWDAVLVWAAGTKKSVDEIGRMIDVMEKSNEALPDKKQWRIPDSTTINALVEYAISQNDPYMAERFIVLGRERKINPDARTFVLQMDYRLSVDDVDGALVAYKHLQAADLSSNEDVSAVNRLIVALCTTQRHDFDTIMNVAADLSDRSARFDPLTVSTLSILHLNRDEIHDVIDLLNTHATAYSSTDRTSIRQPLLSYCLLPATTTPRAWDTYTILRSIFDEMPRPERTDLMLNFFSRSRPDMAVHIFQHMRQHSRADTMPTTDTYVAGFLGCAKLADLESLEVVHNQLKLDYNIDATTYVRNALMIAYCACEQPRRALDFWDEIVASKEGPSYNSIHCALRACEQSPFGDLKAVEIWARLRRNNVELTQELWASYVAALAGNGDNDLAITTLEEAAEKGEVQVDPQVVGNLFTAAPGQMKQREVEGWAKERWAQVWEEVVGVGWVEDEAGMRKVKIHRAVEP